MDSASEEPLFGQLVCQNHLHEESERPFTPVAHDLIILSPEGQLRIAENASVRQITNFLGRSNRELAAIHDAGMSSTAQLAVIRFEVIDEEDPSHEVPSPSNDSNDDWSQLWPFFDTCCNQDDNTIDFVARLRQADAHCHSSFSKNAISNTLHEMECSKLSYSLVGLGRHILIAHHFHKINGEVREMVRMVTCGISLEKLGKVLSKALLFLNIRSSESENGSPGGVMPPTSIPHPIAIMCGMLECQEEWCKEELETHRKKIVKIENDISNQRDPNTTIPKGLEISSLKLSETSIRLGVVRQKLQYLLSSIASLEHMGGPPGGCKRSMPTQNVQSTGNGSPDTSQSRLYHQWWRQLRDVKVRLMGLKGKSEQHNIDIQNIQERIKGILSSVSILLAERENEWSHQATHKQQETMKYQARMLGAQELIASRTKRDNTVMKVIAVLTSLFLPGAFIATLFSVPVFNWNEEDPRGPHFMTYWYFTAPITGTLVIGFSVWFVKMWYDDKQDAKRQAEKEKSMDLEQGLGDKDDKTSLESQHLD